MKRFRLFTGLMFLLLLAVPAFAVSPDWRKALDARTALIWVDGQVLGTMVLNARASLFVTWLPRSLLDRLYQDREVDEWVVKGVSFYSSLDEKTRAKMKGRDILALNYSTRKSWTFDPTELVIGDYRVSPDDILGNPALRGPTGDLSSGVEGTLFICVPSLKPGRSVRIAIGPDSVTLELPKR
ncbi:MAG: hypothetical protein IJU98_04200 [Synergistaceae bacterium]|nr:hypothetical protein [Synergistaceae bacterium]